MTEIQESVYESKISILSTDCLTQLASGLNPKKILHTDWGQLRDWRGLADICGLHGCEIEQFDQCVNPAWQLLQRLLYDLSISKLLYHLEELDRYDIIDDCLEKIYICLQNYQRRLEDQKRYPKGEYQPVTNNDIHAFEAGLPLVMYDAFILYADTSPVDSEYAMKIRNRLEQEALKVCSRDDLIAGMHSEINALTSLIKHRCKTVIMIATNELFQNSSVNTWLVNVTITIGFEQPKKIIPCRIDREVRIPESLAPITKLDFCNSNVDSLARLVNSIRLLSSDTSSQKAITGSTLNLSEKSRHSSGKSSRWFRELLSSRTGKTVPVGEPVVDVSDANKENKETQGPTNIEDFEQDEIKKRGRNKTPKICAVETDELSELVSNRESPTLSSNSGTSDENPTKKKLVNQMFKKLKRKKKSLELAV